MQDEKMRRDGVLIPNAKGGKIATFDGAVTSVRVGSDKENDNGFSTVEFANPQFPFVHNIQQSLILSGLLPLGTKVVVSIETE